MKTWEETVRWVLDEPDLAELARDAYFGDAVAAARRYRESGEYAAIRVMVPHGGGRAIDLGAGSGILAWSLATDGWEVVAVEPDPSELVGAAAIRSLAIETGTPIEVVEALGESIPLPSGGFDLVIARQVLHHAHDLPAFCREMKRLCRPGGIVLTLRDHVISDRSQLEAFQARHPLHRYYGGENAFTLQEYRRALSDAGLKLVKEMRSFQSVLNYSPMTEAEIRDRLAAFAGPLRGPVSFALNAVPFAFIGSVAAALDRRPGRLVSYLARNEGRE
jgi:ubiquinone/menaquinone biosynthesis C-methylase UbiE